ncbi:hypothetical protein CKAH01_14920 [Colletotrichum kahawae]|uniref:Uncharacterized protein n=1 Tax=Colletotrichum kahawae TaxID=34407 RepID=A0AAD9YKI7_COLKA|nr:hypothetical protein CKAH01_14920 [Colletotrichum kahawae]
MSVYLPVPTSVDVPVAKSQDSVSVNSKSQLLNYEEPMDTFSPLQQYELQRLPATRNRSHTISRKPLPTSSTPQHPTTFDRLRSSQGASEPDENNQTHRKVIPSISQEEIEGRFRDNEYYPGHQMNAESSLQEAQHDNDSSEYNRHPPSPTENNAGAPPNTRRARPRSSFVHRLWLWEIAASALSIACMASIIGVLSYEQGRRLDQWGLGKGSLTPNVVVSFLGTLSKSACLLILTEVISQLKWLHFQHRNRKTILASFASTLVVLSLLVDSFIQAVFSQPVILTPVKGVSPGILETRIYDPSALNARSGQCYGAANVQSKMQAAILAPVWNATPAPSLPCSFERCDWPTVTTLGVCSSCEDLTDTAVPTCVINPEETFKLFDCNYTVPSQDATFNAVFGITGGASVRTPYSTVWNSIAGDQWQTTLDAAWNSRTEPSFTESRPAVLSNFTFVKFSPNKTAYDYYNLRINPPVSQAMHCTLELCARTFTTPYYANFSAAPLAGPHTALVTTTDGTTEGNAASAFIGLKPASPGQLSEETNFRINYCNYKDIAKYLMDLFTTSMSTTGVVGTTNDSSTTGFNQQIRQRVTAGLGLAFSQFDDIAELMDEVANSMTEAFRISANNTVLDGVALSSVTYIKITWLPLVLPVALVLMTFTMLVVMIIRNNQRGMPIWKSSSLALLFHELSGWDGSKAAVIGPEEVEEQAKRMRTRVTNGGGKLLFSKAE